MVDLQKIGFGIANGISDKIKPAQKAAQVIADNAPTQEVTANGAKALANYNSILVKKSQNIGEEAKTNIEELTQTAIKEFNKLSLGNHPDDSHSLMLKAFKESNHWKYLPEESKILLDKTVAMREAYGGIDNPITANFTDGADEFTEGCWRKFAKKYSGDEWYKVIEQYEQPFPWRNDLGILQKAYSYDNDKLRALQRADEGLALDTRVFEHDYGNYKQKGISFEDYMETETKRLNELMDKQVEYLSTLEPSKEECTFVRGISSSGDGEFVKFMDKVTEGDIITPDWGISFASPNYSVAIPYSDGRLIKIKTPKGARLPLSDNRLCFPSKAQFKVLGKEKVNGFDVTNLEYILPQYK